MALWEFRGLTPCVGATLVVALAWAGTRPAPPVPITPRNPKGQEFLDQERLNMPKLYLPQAETWVLEQGGQVIGFIPSP